MWLTNLKDKQLQFWLTEMLNFYLDRKSQFFKRKFIAIFNALGA